MEKILVIDDRKDNLTAIEAQISMMNKTLEIVTADSGMSGLEMARIHQPDVILLDIHMPEMDGYEVCRKLKADSLTRQIPVIFLTALRTSAADRIKGLEIGADAFLSKPVNEGELMAEIGVMLRIKRAEDQLRTEKRNLEEQVTLRTKELLAINQRYERLVRNAPDMIFRISLPDGRYEFVSNSSVSVIGYTPQEFYDQPMLIRKVIHPDWKNYFETEWEKLIQGKPDKRYHFQVIHKNSTELWVSQTNVLIRNSEGEPVALEGIVRDITQRMNALNALEKSNEEFQALFTNMLNGFAFHRIVRDESGLPADYVFLNINPAFEKMTGLMKDRVIGKTVRDVIPGIDSDPFNWIEKYGTVSITGKPVAFEQYSAALDKWYSITAYSPEPDHFATIFHDITDQKASEAALRESESRYRLMFETAPVGVISLDREGTVTACNAAFCQMTHYSEEEITGRYFSEFAGLYSEEIPKYVELFRDVISTARMKTIRTPIKIKEGGRINAEVLVVSEKEKGATTGVHAFVMDITKMIEHENSLKDSLKEKEVLLREIHHRVKNNMQIINSLLGLQSQRINNKEAVHALQDSINRIISMSLIHESLFQSEDLVQIGLENYLNNILGHLVQIYFQPGKQVSFKVSAAEFYITVEEATPLGLIFNELITNSLKHAYNEQESGSISIQVTQSDQGETMVEYSDDGAGLPAGFDIQQTDSLGMRLIRDLILRQLEGRLESCSESGFCLRFRFTRKN